MAYYFTGCAACVTLSGLAGTELTPSEQGVPSLFAGLVLASVEHSATQSDTVRQHRRRPVQECKAAFGPRACLRLPHASVGSPRQASASVGPSAAWPALAALAALAVLAGPIGLDSYMDAGKPAGLVSDAGVGEPPRPNPNPDPDPNPNQVLVNLYGLALACFYMPAKAKLALTP